MSIFEKKKKKRNVTNCQNVDPGKINALKLNLS